MAKITHFEGDNDHVDEELETSNEKLNSDEDDINQDSS